MSAKPPASPPPFAPAYTRSPRRRVISALRFVYAETAWKCLATCGHAEVYVQPEPPPFFHCIHCPAWSATP